MVLLFRPLAGGAKEVFAFACFVAGDFGGALGLPKVHLKLCPILGALFGSHLVPPGPQKCPRGTSSCVRLSAFLPISIGVGEQTVALCGGRA